MVPEGTWRFLKVPEGSWRYLNAPEGSSGQGDSSQVDSSQDDNSPDASSPDNSSTDDSSPKDNIQNISIQKCLRSYIRAFKSFKKHKKPDFLNAIQQLPFRTCPKAFYAVVLFFGATRKNFWTINMEDPV